MSKGLTPVVAMILLLMMTVAAAGASFYWLIKIQGELQGGTQQFQEQTFERMTSNVAWQDANFDRSTRNLTINLLNTGTTKIPIANQSSSPKAQWTLLDSEQDIICTSDWNGTVISSDNIHCWSGCDSELGLKELRLIKLELRDGGDCDIDAKANDSLIYAKISFSGKTTASGTFRK